MAHHSNFSQSTYRGESIPLEVEERSDNFQLFTPWTITGLLIILLGNLLLNWTQWQKQEAIKAANQATLQTKPISVNLSPRIKLQSLSLIEVAKMDIKTNIVSQNQANPPSFSVVQPKLSSRLLPPSLDSTNGDKQSYPKYPPSLKPLVSNYPQQTAQSYTKNPSIKINALPIPSPPPTPNLPIKQAIEQNRLEAEQSNSLGFNNKTRAKIQAIKNNQDPNEVIRIMQQLQQQRLNQLSQPSASPSK